MSDTFLKRFKGKTQKMDKTGLPKITSQINKPVKNVILPKANQSHHHMPNGTVNNIQRNYLDFTNTYRDIIHSNQKKNESKQQTNYQLIKERITQNNGLLATAGQNKFKNKIKMKVSLIETYNSQ